MTDIAGKVGFVTGAASGIGRALAVKLAEQGARCVVITDVNEQGLEETAQLVRQKQVNVIARKLDVADRAGFEGLVEETIDTQGGIDLIFNNAGVTVTNTTNDMSYEDFEWLMNINFWGVVHGTKSVLPHMLNKGEGHIVNISSIFGFIGVPTQSTYCAAKFAVRGFTESLTHELEGSGVHSTTVHPGGIKTNIVNNARHQLQDGTSKDDMAANFEKMARTTPDEAAEVILKGVRKNKKRVFIGLDAHIISRFVRWLPGLYFWVMGRGARQGQKRIMGSN